MVNNQGGVPTLQRIPISGGGGGSSAAPAAAAATGQMEMLEEEPLYVNAKQVSQVKACGPESKAKCVTGGRTEKKTGRFNWNL